MKKSFWRGLCITCIVLSVLLAIFHVVLVGLLNAAVVLFAMMTLNPDMVPTSGVGWAEAYANFVGSPLFYIDLAMASVLVISAVMWIVCKKREGKT